LRGAVEPGRGLSVATSPGPAPAGRQLMTALHDDDVYGRGWVCLCHQPPFTRPGKRGALARGRRSVGHALRCRLLPAGPAAVEQAEAVPAVLAAPSALRAPAFLRASRRIATSRVGTRQIRYFDEIKSVLRVRQSPT